MPNVSFDRVICIQVSPGALISPQSGLSQHRYSDTGGTVETVIDPAMTPLPFSSILLLFKLVTMMMLDERYWSITRGISVAKGFGGLQPPKLVA